jgi:hypothetical protein
VVASTGNDDFAAPPTPLPREATITIGVDQGCRGATARWAASVSALGAATVESTRLSACIGLRFRKEQRPRLDLQSIRSD